MATGIVLENLDNGILQVTLNQAEKYNILTPEMFMALEEIFHRAHDDPAVKALLLTANGKAFCAGTDIKQLMNLDAETGRNYALRGQQVFEQMARLNKPVLAAVNGMAIGGGCEFIQAAHLRIAAKEASFSQPEVKLGLIPGYGGTQRLARIIGPARAIDLCITGRRISAEQALQWGLVSEVIPQETLLARGREILLGILEMAPLAIANTIQAIQKGIELPLQEALRLEAMHFGLVCATEDQKEGVNAFLEKRPAKFKGD